MKKLKLMFAGIALITLVGGALAFKAKSSYGSVIWITYTFKDGSKCSIHIFNFQTTTVPNPAIPTLYYYTTLDNDGTCLTTPAYITTIL